MPRKPILPSVISYLNLEYTDALMFRMRSLRMKYQLLSDLMDAIGYHALFEDEPAILADLCEWMKLLLDNSYLASSLDYLYVNRIDMCHPSLQRMKSSPNMRIVRNDKWNR